MHHFESFDMINLQYEIKKKLKMGGKMPLFEVLNENNQHFLTHV